MAHMRIGIVGWGEIAREHASHFAPNGAELAAVVSRRRDLDPGVPVFRNFSEMAPHVDAVTIAVPNHLHASFCLQAIAAEIPALVEKPLCVSRSELRELETAFASVTVPIHLGYRLRWNTTILQIKQRLARPKRIRCIYRFGIEGLADNKVWTRRFSDTGGAFFTLGVHMLDLARWLAGANGRALTELRASARHADDSADYPLDVWMSGRLASGTEIIAGTDLRGAADSAILLEIDADAGSYPAPELPPVAPADERVEYGAMIAHFIRAVETATMDRADLDEILETHRELLAARELARDR